jgi:hypothetical protein
MLVIQQTILSQLLAQLRGWCAMIGVGSTDMQCWHRFQKAPACTSDQRHERSFNRVALRRPLAATACEPVLLDPVSYLARADECGRHTCTRMRTGSDKVQVMVV